MSEHKSGCCHSEPAAHQGHGKEPHTRELTTQHTAEHVHESMRARYGEPAGEHVHDKDHHLEREHEESHPHTQHGGDPEGHKHPVKHREGASHSD
ncbi:MAG: hypothetical protein ACRDCK_06100, partial [Plesiomonas shigelloides]